MSCMPSRAVFRDFLALLLLFLFLFFVSSSSSPTWLLFIERSIYFCCSLLCMIYSHLNVNPLHNYLYQLYVFAWHPFLPKCPVSRHQTP
ncbi:hypothetical protein XELAEV_18029604mg [Xenopus laevis]|uniref:Uncharacterized protein n=1 Tax=Xenopus laevis TaxID=8355 RepID=A0A974CTL3_XENLA|nr:hypothetical protein XELAEV_18029604mg [Xenopus laevis]